MDGEEEAACRGVEVVKGRTREEEEEKVEEAEEDRGREVKDAGREVRDRGRRVRVRGVRARTRGSAMAKAVTEAKGQGWEGTKGQDVRGSVSPRLCGGGEWRIWW